MLQQSQPHNIAEDPEDVPQAADFKLNERAFETMLDRTWQSDQAQQIDVSSTLRGESVSKSGPLLPWPKLIHAPAATVPTLVL